MTKREAGAPFSNGVLFFFAALINLVWAISYPITKKLMIDIPPVGLACWRMLGGAVTLLPFFRLRDVPAKITLKDSVFMVLLGGVGCALATFLQYAGTTRSLASNISLIVALETIMVVVLAALFLREKITWQSVVSLILALSGVLLITVDPKTLDLFSSQYFFGNFLMVLSIICYALYTILCKVMSDRWGASALTVIPFVIAAILMTVGYGVLDPQGLKQSASLRGDQVPGILFVGIVATGLTYLVWNWILKWLPAGELSRSLYVQPVAGFVFSIWLLGETWNWLSVAGCVLVLVGVVLGEIKVRAVE